MVEGGSAPPARGSERASEAAKPGKLQICRETSRTSRREQCFHEELAGSNAAHSRAGASAARHDTNLSPRTQLAAPTPVRTEILQSESQEFVAPARTSRSSTACACAGPASPASAKIVEQGTQFRRSCGRLQLRQHPNQEELAKPASRQAGRHASGGGTREEDNGGEGKSQQRRRG